MLTGTWVCLKIVYCTPKRSGLSSLLPRKLQFSCVPPFLGKPISILHWLNRQQFRWLHSHLLLMAYFAILMVIPISAIPDGLSHLKSLF